MKRKLLISTLAFSLAIPEARSQAFYKPDPASLTVVERRIVNLFPNPALNHATVVLNYQPAEQVYVDLIDFNGQVRRSFGFAPGGNQLSFDVGFLERGYYVVLLRDAYRLIDRVKLVKS